MPGAATAAELARYLGVRLEVLEVLNGRSLRGAKGKGPLWLRLSAPKRLTARMLTLRPSSRFDPGANIS